MRRAALLLLPLLAACPADGPGHALTEAEVALALTLSPLPPPPVDATNRFAEDDAAAHLGRYLFFDRGLSANGRVACASCHAPQHAFADIGAVSTGVAAGTRNSPTVLNASYHRWLFWDGRADSAWAQALHPILDAKELGTTAADVRAYVLADEALAAAYAEVLGAPAGDHDAETVLANLAKCIAAYEHRLVSRRAPFDVFVEGLREDDGGKLAALAPEAQRGLSVFLAKGCRTCHFGPLFTDGEFHDTGVPPPGGGPRVDPGRYEGVKRLLASPFHAAGAHSDDPDGERAFAVRTLRETSEDWGRFKTPSLRNVAATRPYMHAGQLATLEDVVRFYATREGAVSIAHHRETVLEPFELSEEELAALVAFLESLTDLDLPAELLGPPASPRP